MNSFDQFDYDPDPDLAVAQRRLLEALGVLARTPSELVHPHSSLLDVVAGTSVVAEQWKDFGDNAMAAAYQAISDLAWAVQADYTRSITAGEV